MNMEEITHNFWNDRGSRFFLFGKGGVVPKIQTPNWRKSQDCVEILEKAGVLNSSNCGLKFVDNNCPMMHQWRITKQCKRKWKQSPSKPYRKRVHIKKQIQSSG